MSILSYFKRKPTTDGLPDPTGNLSNSMDPRSISLANREVESVRRESSSSCRKKRGPYNQYVYYNIIISVLLEYNFKL